VIKGTRPTSGRTPTIQEECPYPAETTVAPSGSTITKKKSASGQEPGLFTVTLATRVSPGVMVAVFTVRPSVRAPV
jgi:hypothetical protein